MSAGVLYDDIYFVKIKPLPDDLDHEWDVTKEKDGAPVKAKCKKCSLKISYGYFIFEHKAKWTTDKLWEEIPDCDSVIMKKALK